VEPESWENLGADDAIGACGQPLEFAAAADETEDLLLRHGRHHVFAHPGLFVIEFLAVQVNRFRAVAYFADPFGDAGEVAAVVHPRLAAVFGRM